MQRAFRLLVLEGMAERWGAVDASLNPDLDDIAAHYGADCVLVAIDDSVIVGTGILLLEGTEGKIVRMSVCQSHRRRGVATRILTELIRLGTLHHVSRIEVETNAAWTEARRLYEGFGFTFTHSAPGDFGREIFYELQI